MEKSENRQQSLIISTTDIVNEPFIDLLFFKQNNSVLSNLLIITKNNKFCMGQPTPHSA